MNGADEARETLRKAVREHYLNVRKAGVSYAAAYERAIAPNDLVEALQGTVNAVIAAEELIDRATAAAAKMREAIVETMDATGAPKIKTANHLAYLTRNSTFVSVDQADLVPSEFIVTPEPRLDKAKIKAAIDGGEDVPGCSLVRPNSSRLTIRSLKE